MTYDPALTRKSRHKNINRHILTWRVGAYPQKRTKENIRKRKHPSPSEDEDVQNAIQRNFQQPISKTFTILPYELDADLSAAANCWFRDLLPSFFMNLRPHKYGIDTYYLQDIVPFLTQNPLPFYTAMLIATISQDMVRAGRPILSRFGRESLQKLLSSLREALSKGRVRLDDIVYGIEGLASATEYLGLYEQAAAHMKGLKEALAANGGVGVLGLNGMLTGVTTSYFKYHDTMAIIRAREQSNPNCFGRQSYPTLPFSTEFYSTLSVLPPGFTDVALTMTLSERTLCTLTRISKWDRNHHMSPSAASDTQNRFNGTLCSWQLKRPGISLDERMALLGCLAYCIFMAGDPKPWFNLRCLAQLVCRALMTIPLHTIHPRLMRWTGMILKASFGPGNISDRFADRLLDFVRPGWPNPDRALRDSLTHFFWNALLSKALHTSLGNETFVVDDDDAVEQEIRVTGAE